MLKGCITFIDTNQRAYLGMKTRLGRGSSNDLCSSSEGATFLNAYNAVPRFPHTSHRGETVL